jgi:two-component system, LytTR family, sensor kinase
VQNPILKHRKNTLIYILIWSSIALLEFCMGYFYFSLPAKTLLFDVLIQQVFLAAAFLGLWYPLRFFNPSLQSWTVLFFNHAMVVVLLLLIWIPLTRIIIEKIFDADLLYFSAITPLKFILAIFTYLLYVLFVFLFENYQRAFENQKNEQTLIQNLKEAELSLLRNQLNPHFLFNSLNSISSLTLLDPEKAHEMIIKLSDFLRYTVSNGQMQKVTLAQEMDMCRAYLEIEKIRFGEKIILEIHITEDALSAEVPSLLLQPLFENALKHGIHTSLEPEKISLNSRIEEEHLRIVLSNSFDSLDINKIGTKSGLKNIRQRLLLMYKNRGTIDTEITENQFIVRINLPI